MGLKRDPGQLWWESIMAKRDTLGEKQLPLPLVSLDRQYDCNPDLPEGRRVVALVDARTLRVRREAVERVIASGIFAPPKLLPKK